MKNLKLVLLFLAIAASVSAQSKFDFSAQRVLNDYRYPVEINGIAGVSKAPASAPDTEVTAIVTLSAASDAYRLADAGCQIFRIVDNMAIVDAGIDVIERVAALDCVTHISFGQMARPLLDKARAASLVDPVQAGEGLEMPYKGKGVVTSLFDTGLDPCHVNFRHADGQSRVMAIAAITGSSGSTKLCTTPEEVLNFTTENSGETHGTHVLGIMSGSYAGQSVYAGSVNKTSGDMPYYGVATESDIVVTCGDLYDNNILKGVDFAIETAEAANKPAVVNLSLGNNYGPHDGSTSFSRILADYGKRAIICVAAGNEGDIPMAVSKNCTALGRTLKTFLVPTGATSRFNGVVEFYASDDKPFKLSAVIYDVMAKKIISQYDLDKSTSGKPVYVGGSNVGNAVNLQGFDEAYSASSYLQISSNVGSNNNRYGVSITHALDASASSNYWLGFIVEGINGQFINGYANSTNSLTTGVESTFSGRGVTGWTNGSTNGSISDMACGDNIIVIGSYNTRNSWRSLSDRTFSYSGAGFNVGEVSGFSSYGTTFDGRKLPDLCAPGAGIISSISSFYVKAEKLDVNDFCGSVNLFDRQNYWNVMQGTSMACPFAAGTIALWLEADPTLTIDEVVDIAKSTAIKDNYVTTTGSSVQWGAGKLDALAGIKEVVRRAQSGIASVELDDKAVIVIPLGGQAYNVFAGGAAHVAVTLYSLSGQAVASASAQSDELTLDASSLRAGVYVMAVDTPAGRSTRKLAIR